MQTKFGIDVKKVTKHHVYLSVERHKMIEVTRTPASVANVERCELGEHCRCKSYDKAYKQDCWNWIGEVKS
jgi:hypothetical protein